MTTRTSTLSTAFLLIALVALHGSTAAQTTVRPTGIFCSCPPTHSGSSSSISTVLAQPFVDGILVRVGWDLLEPTPGTFDWSLIQSELNLVAAAGKKMTLAVVQGSGGTPSWLSGMGVQTVSYNFAGQVQTRPVPWDATYLARWTSFVAALGTQFDGNPSIALVHATHASHNSLEMQLGISAEVAYTSAGYSPALYAQSWTTVIDTFAASFSQHPIDVDVHPVFGDDSAAQMVASAGQANHGDRFGTFGGWWSVRNAEVTYPGMWSIFQDTATASFANAQNVGSFTTTPERYDHDVDTYAAAFDLGLTTGIRYFEVWNSDLLNPALSPLLTDLHDRVHAAGWYQLYDQGGTVLNPSLSLGGIPNAGETITLDVQGGPNSAHALMAFGTTRDELAVPGGALLIGPLAQILTLNLNLDPTGAATLPATLPTPLLAIDLTVQVGAFDPLSSTWWLSNALEFRIP